MKHERFHLSYSTIAVADSTNYDEDRQDTDSDSLRPDIRLCKCANILRDDCSCGTDSRVSTVGSIFGKETVVHQGKCS